MTQQEELDLYKKALVDWEKPLKFCHDNYTRYGFCWYFRHIHDVWLYDDNFPVALPTLFKQRIYKELFHYDLTGDYIEGRQQRVTALKNAISILENKLKQE